MVLYVMYAAIAIWPCICIHMYIRCYDQLEARHGQFNIQNTCF